MKNWLLAITTIAMLSACGDKKDEFTVEATPQSEAEATTAPAKAVELPQGDKKTYRLKSLICHRHKVKV